MPFSDRTPASQLLTLLRPSISTVTYLLVWLPEWHQCATPGGNISNGPKAESEFGKGSSHVLEEESKPQGVSPTVTQANQPAPWWSLPSKSPCKWPFRKYCPVGVHQGHLLGKPGVQPRVMSDRAPLRPETEFPLSLYWTRLALDLKWLSLIFPESPWGPVSQLGSDPETKLISLLIVISSVGKFHVALPSPSPISRPTFLLSMGVWRLWSERGGSGPPGGIDPKWSEIWNWTQFRLSRC